MLGVPGSPALKGATHELLLFWSISWVFASENLSVRDVCKAMRCNDGFQSVPMSECESAGGTMVVAFIGNQVSLKGIETLSFQAWFCYSRSTAIT